MQLKPWGTAPFTDEDASSRVLDWSPDGQWIAFSNTNGLALLSLTEPSNEWLPSWSADGQWVYFTSDRGNQQLIYKMPARGGPWVRISQSEGQNLYEAPDAQWVYFASNDGTLSKAHSSGSLREESLGRVPGLNPYMPSWDISKNGLYFVNWTSTPTTIDFFEFATREVRTVLSLGPTRHEAGLSVSPDERWIAYTRIDYLNSDIRMIESFR